MKCKGLDACGWDSFLASSILQLYYKLTWLKSTLISLLNLASSQFKGSRGALNSVKGDLLSQLNLVIPLKKENNSEKFKSYFNLAASI